MILRALPSPCLHCHAPRHHERILGSVANGIVQRAIEGSCFHAQGNPSRGPQVYVLPGTTASSRRAFIVTAGLDS